jgi:hypothetical protein
MEINETTISLILSGLSILIASVALILHYIKFQRDKPILTVIPYISSYTIQKMPEFNLLKIDASFLINNSGNISTSITGSTGFIRLLPNSSILGQMFKIKGILGTANPANLPIEIKANNTTTINLNYTFEYDSLNALDSCMRPIQIYITPQKPEIPSRDDVILHVNFNFLTTHQRIIKTSCCIFRKDQPESQRPDMENTGLIISSVASKYNEQLRIT